MKMGDIKWLGMCNLTVRELQWIENMNQSFNKCPLRFEVKCCSFPIQAVLVIKDYQYKQHSLPMRSHGSGICSVVLKY